MPEELPGKPGKFSAAFSLFAVVIFLFVIAVNFYVLYFQKDYDFIVETSCDLLSEECFYRDCTNTLDCPPNGLAHFKRYTISASDFPMCTKEDCTAVCESESVPCEQIACEPDEEFGESCTTPMDYYGVYYEDPSLELEEI